MTTITLCLHSFVDLITNSSTEMYIDYSGSIEPCKEMINGIFKAFNIEKTCDEVFDLRLRNENDEDRARWDKSFDLNAPWEEDECCPALLIITAKDPSFDHLAKLIKNFLESGETKEFSS
jgi:hypothetical protein